MIAHFHEGTAALSRGPSEEDHPHQACSQKGRRPHFRPREQGEDPHLHHQQDQAEESPATSDRRPEGLPAAEEVVGSEKEKEEEDRD